MCLDCFPSKWPIGIGSKPKYPDFLWGPGFDLMVSDRVRRLYEDAGLTGIRQFDPSFLGGVFVGAG